MNDLVNLLNHTDMEAVLTDFGRRTRQEDPIVHFYETFLAAYDPKLREARGVYYTPEPVVSYIARSVDALLKTRFNCPQGLADSSTITIPNYDPSLTVKGNPPYSGHSANKSDWIEGLLKGKLPNGSKTDNYYEVDSKPLGERNPKYLQDDYVKFIRFGQWRIERSGGGILAFITNHGYLDNPTFRGMRQSLMQTFTDIYILDLHGNAKKRETAPDGCKDDNVFDIQQGVAIGIFVKQPGKSGPAKVYHADLWGTRAQKYEQLFEQDVIITEWQQLTPQPPFYLFASQNVDLQAEYAGCWSSLDIFPLTTTGIKTHRDHFAVGFEEAELLNRVIDFRNLQKSSEELSALYKLKNTRDWKIEPFPFLRQNSRMAHGD